MSVALITGASQGFGAALAHELARRGWDLILTARTAPSLAEVAGTLGAVAVVGDVTDPAHRAELVTAGAALGGLDLLVNNASLLGPMPPLAELSLPDLRRIVEVNVVAPLALTQLVLPGAATVVNISSDAAVAAYPGWGAYGSSKAALDRMSAVLAAENADARVYAFDPGDMRTAMHQEAFPGEDITDRPLPETVVPTLLRLLDERPVSGRYCASELS